MTLPEAEDLQLIACKGIKPNQQENDAFSPQPRKTQSYQTTELTSGSYLGQSCEPTSPPDTLNEALRDFKAADTAKLYLDSRAHRNSEVTDMCCFTLLNL